MKFKKYKEMIIGVLSVIALIFFWIWDIGNGRNDLRKINDADLTEIRATLSNTPTIETAEQGGAEVPIQLKEFPEFHFDVGGIKYQALHAREFVKDLSAGDSIQLSILTYDYQTKIKKEKSLRPSETLINYRLIEPYSIKSNGKIYMVLADVNAAWQDDHHLGFWILYWIMGLVGLGGLIYTFLHFTGFNRRFVTWWNNIQNSH